VTFGGVGPHVGAGLDAFADKCQLSAPNLGTD